MIFQWRPQDDVSRMETLMRSFLEGARPQGEEKSRLTRSSWVPAVDAWEVDDGFYMVFDLPGIKKEDIEIEVEGDQLTLKGERKPKDEVEFLRRERVYGPFYRSFTLETPVDQSQIKASYKQGVLEIFLPKREEVKPKQISIEIEEE